MGSRLGVDISFYALTVYSISYASSILKLPSSTVHHASPFGFLSDRLGLRKVYTMGLVALFATFQTPNAVAAYLAIAVVISIVSSLLVRPIRQDPSSPP